MYESFTAVFSRVYAMKHTNDIGQSFWTSEHIYAWRALWAPSAHAHWFDTITTLVFREYFFKILYLFTFAKRRAEDFSVASGTRCVSGDWQNVFGYLKNSIVQFNYIQIQMISKSDGGTHCRS